jgi:predicted ferric reductase
VRKSIIVGVVVAIVLLAVADAIATRVNLVAGALPRADGPWCWISSRASGVAAYLTLAANACFGLLLSTRRGDRWVARGRIVEIHQWLSGATLGLVAAHALWLLGDRFMRFDALDVLVPFLAPYEPLAVGCGVLAAYVALLVHGSFALRRTIGVGAWRKLHYLTFLLFVLATFHGVFAGTDSRLPWMAAMYGIAGAAVALLIVRRLLVFPWRVEARRRALLDTSS